MARRDGASSGFPTATGNGKVVAARNGAAAPPPPVTPEEVSASPTPAWSGAARRRARARMERLAERLADPGARRAVRRAAEALRACGARRGGGGAKKRAQTRVADCLEAVAALPDGAERWLAAEAAAWAVAIATRAERALVAPEARESLVGRLADILRPAGDAVAAGDTRAAPCLIVAGEWGGGTPTAARLAERARESLEGEILGLVDDDGVVRTSGRCDAPARVALVAGWASAREALVVVGSEPWSRAVESRFRAACRFAVMLLGPGGVCPGADEESASDTAPLLDAVEECCGGRARATLGRLRGKGGAGGRLLPRETASAAGCQAVIRSGWDASDLRVFLDWQGATPWLEIAVGRRRIVAGPWPASVAVGGSPVADDGPWRLTSCEPCRHGTFLEIEVPLSGGGSIQRQVVVMARDRVVLLGDAVVRRAAGALAFESRLTAAPSTTITSPDEARERFLVAGRARCAVVPLALPEWNAAPAPGALVVETAAGGSGGCLRLGQSGDGARLFAPLWLDCDPDRAAGPLTWRQLTVADTRRILARHEAVGYRVQAGTDQWLVYRALDEPRNRTLLGCNVACEFVLGRVKPRGRVGRSIEIE